MGFITKRNLEKLSFENVFFKNPKTNILYKLLYIIPLRSLPPCFKNAGRFVQFLAQ